MTGAGESKAAYGEAANVFGKVMKLFENGMEDSTAWMARGIGERLREASASDRDG